MELLLGNLGNRQIEPELLRIVKNYAFLDKLSLYNIENQYLSACLPYIAFRETVGSLAAYDNFDLLDYSDFLSMSKNVKEKAGMGSEPFPRTLLKPMKKNVNLQLEVQELLVEYYNNAYDYSFVVLSKIHVSSLNSITVLPKVNQFGRLRLGAEVFGSTFLARHSRSANILSRFVLDNNNTTEIFPGRV
ncbi:hypothetical protein C1646_758227 [Rhizophagus diaphanus]|nr:hypothetical protein C1646_758227 [Rhizophagus diaphanus] [Rhizophagus sp. MUCL 43196]